MKARCWCTRNAASTFYPKAIRSTILYIFAFTSLQNLILSLPLSKLSCNAPNPYNPHSHLKLLKCLPVFRNTFTPLSHLVCDDRGVFMLGMIFTIILPGLSVTFVHYYGCALDGNMSLA
jgi:hypothetical protein